MPTAPEPAQRSRNRAPLTRGARILKSVSRRRSEVGRVSNDGGLFSLRPRYFPAIIRMKAIHRFRRLLRPTLRRLGVHFSLRNLWTVPYPTAASFIRASLSTRLIIFKASAEVLR